MEFPHYPELSVGNIIFAKNVGDIHFNSQITQVSRKQINTIYIQLSSQHEIRYLKRLWRTLGLKEQ